MDGPFHTCCRCGCYSQNFRWRIVAGKAYPSSYCRDCEKQRNKEYSQAHPKPANPLGYRRRTPDDVKAERAREHSRRNYAAHSTDHNVRVMKTYDLVQRRANVAVRALILGGYVIPQPCSVPHCGVTRVVAHHPDYGKPLDIVWLCRRHHRLHHNGSFPEIPKAIHLPIESLRRDGVDESVLAEMSLFHQ